MPGLCLRSACAPALANESITAFQISPQEADQAFFGRSGGIRTPEAFASAPKADPVPGYGLHSDWRDALLRDHLSVDCIYDCCMRRNLNHNVFLKNPRFRRNNLESEDG